MRKVERGGERESRGHGMRVCGFKCLLWPNSFRQGAVFYGRDGGRDFCIERTSVTVLLEGDTQREGEVERESLP